MCVAVVLFVFIYTCNNERNLFFKEKTDVKFES